MHPIIQIARVPWSFRSTDGSIGLRGNAAFCGLSSFFPANGQDGYILMNHISPDLDIEGEARMSPMTICCDSSQAYILLSQV